MTIEHSGITDPHIHEPKGAAGASEGQVYKADGLGSGSFQDLSLGNLSIVSTSTSHSTASQQPTVQDVPLQIQFDSSSVGEDVDVASTGEITVKTTGVYAITFTGRFTRTTSAGVATLMARYLINGTQVPFSTAETLDDGNFSIPMTVSRVLPLEQGMVLTVQFMRDGGGVNNGGLEPFVPTDPGWAPIPSVVVRLDRVGVV